MRGRRRTDRSRSIGNTKPLFTRVFSTDRVRPPRAPYRPPAGFGVARVIFVRLDVGLHELGRHQLDLMAMCAEASSPVMRAATGFHPDEHGGQLGDSMSARTTIRFHTVTT